MNQILTLVFKGNKCIKIQFPRASDSATRAFASICKCNDYLLSYLWITTRWEITLNEVTEIWIKRWRTKIYR